MNAFIKNLIPLFVNYLASQFPPDTFREILDDLLDSVEDKAAKTSTPIDDMVLAYFRTALNIPDDIGGDED
jgi:hypothetical protein